MQGKLLGFWHEQLMMVQLTGMKKPGKGEQHGLFFGGEGQMLVCGMKWRILGGPKWQCGV